MIEIPKKDWRKPTPGLDSPSSPSLQQPGTASGRFGNELAHGSNPATATPDRAITRQKPQPLLAETAPAASATAQQPIEQAQPHPLVASHQLLEHKEIEPKLGLTPNLLASEDFVRFLDDSQTALLAGELEDEAVAIDISQVPVLGAGFVADVPALAEDTPLRSKMLALLSGDLSEIAPEDISKLIMTHPLTQGAAASEDIPAYFTNALPIAQLEKLLEAPIDLQTLGLTQRTDEETSSLEAALKSLGLDPERAMAELTAMQGHLAVGDLSPYIDRAKAQQPQTMMPMAAASPLATLPTDQQMAPGQANSSPLATSDLAATPTLADMSPQQKTEDNLLKIDSYRTYPSKPSALNQDPTGTLAGQAGQTPLADQLFQLNLQATSEPQAATNINKAVAAGEIDGPVDDSEASTTKIDSFGDALAQNKNNTSVTQDSKQSGQQGGQQQQPSQSTTGVEGVRTEGQAGDTDFSQLLPKDSVGSPVMPTAVKVEGANPTQLKNEAALQEMRQVVFEKAQFLATAGGGQMKFDMSTPDLGSLEFSLQIHDKNLELKINASSVEAREMLSVELPQLRQSLMNQSLDIKTVEVGVTHDQNFSQSFTDQHGQGSRESSQSSSEESFASPHSGGFRSQRVSRSLEQRYNPMIATSQIQVRV